MTFLIFQTVFILNLMNGLVHAAVLDNIAESCPHLEVQDLTKEAMKKNIAGSFAPQTRWSRLAHVLTPFRVVPAASHLEMFLRNTLEAVQVTRAQTSQEPGVVDKLLLYLGRKQRVLDEPLFRKIDMRNRVKDDRGTLKREQATEQVKYIRTVAEYNLALEFLNQESPKLEPSSELTAFEEGMTASLKNMESYHGYRLGIERSTPSEFPSATTEEAIMLYRRAAVQYAHETFVIAQRQFMKIVERLKTDGVISDKRSLLTWEYNLARSLLLFELLESEQMPRKDFPVNFGDPTVSNTLRLLAIYKGRLQRLDGVVSVISQGERFIGPRAPKADIPKPAPTDIRRWLRDQDAIDKEVDRAEITRQLDSLANYLSYLIGEG